MSNNIIFLHPSMRAGKVTNHSILVEHFDSTGGPDTFGELHFCRWKMCDKQDNFSSVSKIYLEEVKEKIIFMGTLYFHFLPNDKPGIKEL